jgi:polysaccharide export outer membrane protein
MMKRFFFLFAILLTTVMVAQDLSGIKVDDLTDAQVRQIFNQGQAQGLSIAEGEQMALNMGLSPEEAAKFKARIEKLNGGAAATPASGTNSLITTEVSEKAEGNITKTAAHAGQKVAEPKTELPVNIYGQQIFRRGDLKIYERSLDAKAPSNYVLGEGDQLGVSVFGSSYFQKEYTVDSRGNIAMETWGKINVRGLTFDQVQKLIKARISPYFNMSSNDMTITLSYSRTITVNIVGEVMNPGSYKLPAINTAFNALVAAGGPNDMGTLRDIQVLRDGQVIQRLDVYQFLLNPQFKGEFYLQDNDYLFVGPAENVVSIGGEIMRPMAYELLEKENLLDLLQLAGGTTPKAYTDRIQIERMGDNKVSLVDIPSALFGSTQLKRGDSVWIPAMDTVLRRFVTIDGAVMQPGTYSFEEGLTAEALIQLAGGTLPDVVRKEAYISRMKEDQTLAFISFNLDEALHGKGPALKNKDRLSILGVPDFDENMAVSIAGAVREPKTIAFAEGMTLGDVLRLAGGLNPNADYTRVEVNRLTAFSNYQGGTNREVRTVAAVTEVPKELSKSLDIEDPSLEFTLQPYDQVVVREIPDFELQNLVLIQGEVRYPGYYALLSKDEKVASLVQRAGGLTPYASAKNASLVREGKPNIAMDLNAALATKSSQFNIVMVEGDALEIPRTESLISITGPGTKYFVRNGEQTVNAPFVPGRRSHYYVKQFGLGYAKKADKSETYLTYENGQFKKSLDFGLFRIHPVVRSGATIHTVLAEPKANKEKKEVKPLDWNQAVATVTSAVMGFSTVYVLLTR